MKQTQHSSKKYNSATTLDFYFLSLRISNGPGMGIFEKNMKKLCMLTLF